MDFFEAQARAKQRTSRLLILFGIAVVGTIVTAYFAAVFILHFSGGNNAARSRYGDYDARSSAIALWQPGLFATVSMGTLAVVGLASLYKWKEYSAGGSAVAESVGGRRVDPHTTNLNERRLLNVVEEMAIASGTPVPAVFILDAEPAINAFAAGLTTSDAVVAVTRGTLEKLNRDEMQGVIGHEFSHILNGDMRLNLRIAATVFGILVLGLAGRGILWSLRNTRVRSRGKDNNGVLLAILAAGVALVIIGYIGYFFGRIVQAAVSRQREFLADASAVQFTRNPAGLTGALKKIGGYALGSKMESNKSAAIGHFFFAQAFRSGLTGLWSTHPPLDERIRAIDPTFDGKFFEPPEVVDVAHESFVTAGLAPPLRRAAAVATPIGAAASFTRLPPSSASSAVQAIGSLTPEQLVNAQLLLDATPDRLRLAAQTPSEARILVFGVLLDDEPAVRARQRELVNSRSGTDALRLLDELEPAFPRLRPEH
jgi:Zn-dependent protease with chaperone function